MNNERPPCPHEYVERVSGGFRCTECMRVFNTELATEEGAVLRKAAIDTTALLKVMLEQLYRHERHLEQMDSVLMRLGWSICTEPNCMAYFGQGSENEVNGLPYCEEHYQMALDRFLERTQEDPGNRIARLVRERYTPKNNRTAPVRAVTIGIGEDGVGAIEAYDQEEVTRCAPRWAWDIIDETLQIDQNSSAATEELRQQIQDAVSAMIDCCEKAED